MKWFGARWYGALECEEQRRIEQAYRAHLAALSDALPCDLRCLAEAGGTLTLHDANVLVLCSDDARRQVIIDLKTASYDEGDPRGPSGTLLYVRITYSNAQIIAPGPNELWRYRKELVDVIDGEVDLADDGRFEHRLQFEGDHPTMVLRFGVPLRNAAPSAK